MTVAVLCVGVGTHEGLVPATYHADQGPSCELPIFVKKFSRARLQTGLD